MLRVWPCPKRFLPETECLEQKGKSCGKVTESKCVLIKSPREIKIF